MVGQETPDGDRSTAVESGLDRKLGKVGLQWPVDVEFALLCKLHCRGRREKVGKRPDPVNRLRGRDQFLFFISISETFRPDHLLVVHQRDAQSDDVVFFHLFPDQLGYGRLDGFIIDRHRGIGSGVNRGRYDHGRKDRNCKQYRGDGEELFFHLITFVVRIVACASVE